jgi:hypothetical protein
VAAVVEAAVQHAWVKVKDSLIRDMARRSATSGRYRPPSESSRPEASSIIARSAETLVLQTTALTALPPNL